MKIEVGFWDTSAIVPLCVQQASTQPLRQLWRKSHRVVVWWGTTVEARSALSRLNTEKMLDAKGLQLALTRLEAMRKQWREILPSDKVRDIAETLPDVYDLRALESFQLAAALVWCQAKPNNRQFICDDPRLSAAAQKKGFIVKP